VRGDGTGRREVGVGLYRRAEVAVVEHRGVARDLAILDAPSTTYPPTFGRIGTMWPSTWALSVRHVSGQPPLRIRRASMASRMTL
jgi:hypothetical protein